MITTTQMPQCVDCREANNLVPRVFPSRDFQAFGWFLTTTKRRNTDWPTVKSIFNQHWSNTGIAENCFFWLFRFVAAVAILECRKSRVEISRWEFQAGIPTFQPGSREHDFWDTGASGLVIIVMQSFANNRVGKIGQCAYKDNLFVF